MALTVSQAFDIFLSNLEITDYQEEKAIARHTPLRLVIEKRFTLSEHFLTGSYKKKTMVRPMKDNDIGLFVVLDAGYANNYFYTQGNGLGHAHFKVSRFVAFNPLATICH